MKEVILIPATVARVASRKDRSLSVCFDTSELPPQKAGALYAMQNSAVYLAVKETAFNAADTEELDSLESDFVDDKKKTPSRRLRGVLYRLWEQQPEGYADYKAHYAAKMETIIEHFKNKLD